MTKWANAGTKLAQKQTEPNTVARPNSVILIPWRWKDSRVTASSGNAIPKAIKMPAIVALSLYLAEMFSNDGMRNFSLIMPWARSR